MLYDGWFRSPITDVFALYSRTRYVISVASCIISNTNTDPVHEHCHWCSRNWLWQNGLSVTCRFFNVRWLNSHAKLQNSPAETFVSFKKPAWVKIMSEGLGKEETRALPINQAVFDRENLQLGYWGMHIGWFSAERMPWTQFALLEKRSMEKTCHPSTQQRVTLHFVSDIRNNWKGKLGVLRTHRVVRIWPPQLSPVWGLERPYELLHYKNNDAVQETMRNRLRSVDTEFITALAEIYLRT
jgi:hypothetical protein